MNQNEWKNFLIKVLILFSSFLNVYAGNPSCTVTSMMPGSMFSSSMEGTCYPTNACKSLKGIAIGSCGGSNVCCVFPRTCDAVSAQNHTYFTNPGYPSVFNGTSSCSITIHKAKSAYKICQLRLDFIDFELNRPTKGNCKTDRFIISGQNSNSIIPPLCGRNTNQHVYLDIDAAQGPFTLRVTTSSSGYRRWNIQITQIECANPSKAPANCLQYFTSPSGQIFSFNYDFAQLVPSADSNQQVQTLAGNSNQTIQSSSHKNEDYSNSLFSQYDNKDETGYLNGLDYTICFRKEIGFCSQTYYVNSTNTQFEILNTDHTGNPTFDQSLAGVGIQRCPYDYLVLNSIRFCGSRLNFNGISQNVNTDSSIIDTSSGPFTARFVSDFNLVGRGFRINYQQNPCGSSIQTNTIPNFG